jgi:hypothetical protein
VLLQNRLPTVMPLQDHGKTVQSINLVLLCPDCNTLLRGVAVSWRVRYV